MGDSSPSGGFSGTTHSSDDQCMIPCCGMAPVVRNRPQIRGWCASRALGMLICRMLSQWLTRICIIHRVSARPVPACFSRPDALRDVRMEYSMRRNVDRHRLKRVHGWWADLGHRISLNQAWMRTSRRSAARGRLADLATHWLVRVRWSGGEGAEHSGREPAVRNAFCPGPFPTPRLMPGIKRSCTPPPLRRCGVPASPQIRRRGKS